jgi:hypothetical protein
MPPVTWRDGSVNVNQSVHGSSPAADTKRRGVIQRGSGDRVAFWASIRR